MCNPTEVTKERGPPRGLGGGEGLGHGPELGSGGGVLTPIILLVVITTLFIVYFKTERFSDLTRPLQLNTSITSHLYKPSYPSGGYPTIFFSIIKKHKFALKVVSAKTSGLGPLMLFLHFSRIYPCKGKFRGPNASSGKIRNVDTLYNADNENMTVQAQVNEIGPGPIREAMRECWGGQLPPFEVGSKKNPLTYNSDFRFIQLLSSQVGASAKHPT